MRPDRIPAKIIDDLIVKCPNKLCKWQDRSENLSDHVLTCTLANLTYNNPGDAPTIETLPTRNQILLTERGTSFQCVVLRVESSESQGSEMRPETAPVDVSPTSATQTDDNLNISSNENEPSKLWFLICSRRASVLKHLCLIRFGKTTRNKFKPQ